MRRPHSARGLRSSYECAWPWHACASIAISGSSLNTTTTFPVPVTSHLPSTNMTFSDLPTEIVSRMLTFLRVDGEVDLDSLKNVRLCSRRLNVLAQPQFYSSFRETTPNSLLRLLRETSKDDRISKYCETFQDCSALWWRDASRLRVLSGPVAEEMFTAILDGHVGDCLRASYDKAAEHGSRHPSGLIEAMRDDESRGLMTLALLSLPAIQHLEWGMVGLSRWEVEYLEENPGLRHKPRTYSWLTWLFDRAGDLQKSPRTSYFTDVGNLHKLESIDFHIHGPKTLAFSQIAPYITLKSLRSFSWSCVDIYWDMSARMRLPNIKSLYLTDVALGDEALGKLMAIFTALETLELRTGLFIKMATHIKHLQPTLRRLILKNTYGPQAYVQKPAQRSSYEGFDKLEVLEVAAPQIDGWVSDLIHQDHVETHEAEMTPLERVIPSTVQQLTISCCGKRVLQKVRTLVKSDWLEQSRLTRLVLNCHWKYKTWIDVGLREQWGKECKDAGIELVLDYRYWEPNSGTGIQSYV